MEAANVVDLPFVDEHAVRVRAEPGTVWAALGPTLQATFDRRRSRRLARLLGARERGAAEPFELVRGATAPGFRVLEVDPPRTLTVQGRHRFAEYALILRLARDGTETVVRAETRARFPGLLGRLYRALVIGSRAHVVVTRRILRSLARRAEASGRAARGDRVGRG